MPLSFIASEREEKELQSRKEYEERREFARLMYEQMGEEREYPDDFYDGHLHDHGNQQG
jgi:hypothetical protein